MDPDIITSSSAEFKPLPAGKLYHIFFSHSSEDAEWVRETVEKLESPEYGYKCCYADRDFGVGIPVLQNITTCIHTSVRTVLVLSPEYLRSNWCTYEARITAEPDIDTQKRILVPILLKECNIPNFIGRLSYISVGNEHFWDRLIEAIDRSDNGDFFPNNEDLLMTISTIGLHTCRENGHFLLEKPVHAPCRGNLIEESEYLPAELAPQVSQQEYDNVMRTLAGDFYIRRQIIFAIKSAILIILLLVLIPIDIILFNATDTFVAAVSLMTVLLGLVLICQTGDFLIRYRSARRATLKQMNRIICHKNVLIGLCNNNGYCTCCTKELKIKFFYYDWKPCQLHLENFLASNEGNHSVERMTKRYRGTEDPERLITEDVEVAQEILLYFSMEYGDLLASRKLKQEEQRHTDQGECLCQFAESFLDDTSRHSYRFSCIFGGPSRQPWRRLFYNDT